VTGASLYQGDVCTPTYSY